MNKSIKLVGVGGQGTILAAKVLCYALIEGGYDVKMSEIHGMSQRGGSVSSEIRYGDTVYSPVIEKGHADVLVSFEKMEAARAVDYLKKEGSLLVNDLKINSMITLNGKVPYPKDIVSSLNQKVPTTLIEGTKLAEELGNSKAMNIIMLGALVKTLNLEHLNFKKSIMENVKPRFVELNLKAFDIGLNTIK